MTDLDLSVFFSQPTLQNIIDQAVKLLQAWQRYQEAQRKSKA